ncbi:hypothetical protein [Streptomyces chartreusis]|uniref:hypothetical protein n=1 Tax=Streptomyces chartreusis TaxID=1969 RepID=UPI002E823618|nr:hypothetical protein [Streptomyces chartreusis]WUB22919.1 hypothetical protein OG997_42190 [Streptomyces chartreusis]
MRGRTARAAWILASGAAALTLLSATGAHAEGRGDIRVTKTVVNGGNNVIIGTSARVTYPIAITIRDNSGVKGLTDISVFNRTNGWGFSDWVDTRCEKLSSTTSVCTASMTIAPAWLPDSVPSDVNSTAGVWQVNATVKAKDGDYWISDHIAEFKMKRASKLTTDAAPEPVAKGATLTVTGKLSRANWEDLKYHGYSRQDVKLQFKKAGAASYSTVKTVKTGDTGQLSTKVTATSAGSWRWYFPGTTTTARVVSTGDAVTLK